MMLWSTLTNAFSGWQLILQGSSAWRDRYSLTRAGFATALAIFAFIAFLTVALASMSIGMPNGLGVLAAMMVLALPVVALLITLLITRNVLRSSDAILPMLVPGTYALTVFLVVEGILALLGGPLVMLSWVAMGYLLFRLARVAAGWNLGVAAGFAVLTVLLLVVMRVALYMLTNPAGSPI